MEKHINSAEVLFFSKNTGRLIVKLMDGHSAGKITDEAFTKNLKLIQDAVNKKIDKLLNKEDNLVLNDKFENVLTEFFEQKGLVEPQTPLFVSFKEIENNITNGNLDDLQNFIKMNKNVLKETKSDLDEELQIQVFINFVLKNKKTEAIEYVRKSGINPKNIQKWTNILISDKEEQLKMNDYHIGVLLEEYKDVLLYIKGIPRETRLVNRILAGILSINTTKCGESSNKKDCPTCIPWISEIAHKMPQSKRQNTFLVCVGTGAQITEDNRPLFYSSRWVYSETYLKKYGYIVYCEKTGRYLMERPKKIFFL